MARLTIGQKAQRALKLMMGLRNPRIAEALGAYGFTQADLDEGHKLLGAVAGGKLSQLPVARRDPSLLARLDEWENRWFPVASASLARRFPEAHAYLFLNLTQTEGAEVIVSVSTFIDRIDRLVAEPSVENGAAARELLAARGLTAGTLDLARELLGKLRVTAPASPAPAVDAAQAEQDEDALWAWYLEWGEIARIAVKDRRALRELGFLSEKRTLAEEVEDEHGAEHGAPSAGSTP